MIGRIALVAVLAIALSAGGAYAAPTCAGDFVCPYGYAADSTKGTSETLTVEECCKRDSTMKSFPVCKDASSGGGTATQAASVDEVSWLVQDGNGFVRSVGKYRGICFTVLVNDFECNPNGLDSATTTCCSKKRPVYLQFKLPTSTVTSISGTGGTSTGKKCKLSYGTAVVTSNGLKRISKWSIPATGVTDTSFVNVPLTWKRNAKATTVCLYSDYTADDSCQFEEICGLNRADTDALAVPDASGSYQNGCEMRIVGRATAASSACCTPTFAVDAFDSNAENRLADGAPAGQTIELHGV